MMLPTTITAHIHLYIYTEYIGVFTIMHELVVKIPI